MSFLGSERKIDQTNYKMDGPPTIWPDAVSEQLSKAFHQYEIVKKKKDLDNNALI